MGRSSGFDWSAPGRIARVQALRSEGLDFHRIALLLSAEWGVTLTDSQVRSAWRWHAPQETQAEASARGLPDVQAAQRRASEGRAEGRRSPETTAGRTPFIQTSKTRAEGYLVIPDLQAPFHAPGGLEFCEKVRREFAIAKENVLFAGDEVDNFHGKGLDKKGDPDAVHTPRQELAAAVEELRRWYSTYPNVRLAVSNHGTRYERRAAEANISSQWTRLYRDVIEAPPGWQWQDRWVICASKQPFVLEHGHEGGGSTELKVLENGYSTVHGHQTQAKVLWMTNHLGRRLWGMCVGGLIDHDTYAFAYAKKYKRKIDNGVGVILDGGRIPLWVPLFSTEGAQWPANGGALVPSPGDMSPASATQTRSVSDAV